MRLFIQDECLADRFVPAFSRGALTYGVVASKNVRVFRFHREFEWYVVDLEVLPSAIEAYDHKGDLTTLHSILPGKGPPLRVKRSLDPSWRPHRIDFAIYDRHLVRAHSFLNLPTNVSAYDWTMSFLAGSYGPPAPFSEVAPFYLGRREDPLGPEGVEALKKAYALSNGRHLFSLEELARGVEAVVYVTLRPLQELGWVGRYLDEERALRQSAMEELRSLPSRVLGGTQVGTM